MLQAIKRLIKRITINLIRAVRKLFTTNTTADIATKTEKEKEMRNTKTTAITLASATSYNLQFFRKDGQRWFAQRDVSCVYGANYYPGANIGRPVIVSKKDFEYFANNKRVYRGRVYLPAKELVQYIKDRTEVALDARKMHTKGNHTAGWSTFAADAIEQLFGMKVPVSAVATKALSPSTNPERRRVEEALANDSNARRAYVSGRRARAYARAITFNMDKQEALLYSVFGKESNDSNRNRNRQTKGK